MTSPTLHFALNHIAAPQLPLPEFFALARRLGLRQVEIRNDIAGRAILDGTPARKVRAMARDAGVTILTINALQRFNDGTPRRAEEAKALIDYAHECAAGALILVPMNDGSGRADGERQANVQRSLEALKPLLRDAQITGLVEPLGFEICSLRSKREAVEAIMAVGGTGIFRITHDTFHHHLAGEPELFPAHTGLVHISGVSDPAVAVGDMRDSHRILVDAADRVGNVEQLAALRAAGYAGPLSFEPFADELRTLPDPAAAIGESIEFITAQLAVAA